MAKLFFTVLFGGFLTAITEAMEAALAFSVFFTIAVYVIKSVL